MLSRAGRRRPRRMPFWRSSPKRARWSQRQVTNWRRNVATQSQQPSKQSAPATSATQGTEFDAAAESEILETIIQQTEASIDAISPLMRAEIDIQISTAKRYPRSIRRFQQEAQSMACLDEDTAAECMYS